MSNYSVRFNVNRPVICVISAASIYTGFCLYGQTNIKVSEEVYNRDFKESHPQKKLVVLLTKNIIENILSNYGAELPVGYLIGQKTQPLQGETERYKCTDFILTPYELKYQITAEDKKKFDKANLTGQILGRFIGGVPLRNSKLESDIIKYLEVNKICIIIRGSNIGEQRAIKVVSPSVTEEIGIYVE